MEGSTQHWQKWLPLIQLSMNSAVTARTDTAPFALMFARPVNDPENYDVLEAIKEKNKGVEEIVKPAILEKPKMYNNEVRKRLDDKRKIVEEIKLGTMVYAIDKTRSSNGNQSMKVLLLLLDVTKMVLMN